MLKCSFQQHVCNMRRRFPESGAAVFKEGRIYQRYMTKAGESGGYRVRYARFARRISQRELSQALGVPLQRIVDVERGRVSIPPEEIERWVSTAESISAK